MICYNLNLTTFTDVHNDREDGISALYIVSFSISTQILHLSQWLLLGIFVQKVFKTNFNFKYQRVQNIKNNSTFIISISKFYTGCFSFFQISYSLVSKIKICQR